MILRHSPAPNQFQKINVTVPVKLRQRIQQELELSLPNAPEDCAEAFEEFLSQELRHFKVREETVPKKLYHICRTLKRWSRTSEKAKDYAVLDSMYERLLCLGQSGLYLINPGDPEASDGVAKAAFEILFYADGFWKSEFSATAASSTMSQIQSNHFWQAAVAAGGMYRRALSQKVKDAPSLTPRNWEKWPS